MATFLTMGSPNSRPLHLGDSVSDRPCCSEVGIGRSETIEMTRQSFAVGPRSNVHSTNVHSTDVHSTGVIPVAANGGGPFLFGFDHPIFAW
jgi:hypothetical protein